MEKFLFCYPIVSNAVTKLIYSIIELEMKYMCGASVSGSCDSLNQYSEYEETNKTDADNIINNKFAFHVHTMCSTHTHPNLHERQEQAHVSIPL